MVLGRLGPTQTEDDSFQSVWRAMKMKLRNLLCRDTFQLSCPVPVESQECLRKWLMHPNRNDARVALSLRKQAPAYGTRWKSHAVSSLPAIDGYKKLGKNCYQLVFVVFLMQYDWTYLKFWQISSSLTHHPNRHSIHIFAASRPQQIIIFQCREILWKCKTDGINLCGGESGRRTIANLCFVRHCQWPRVQYTIENE